MVCFIFEIAHVLWGNGIVQGSEGWDDNNTVSGDGWDEVCQIEDGYTCFNQVGSKSLCNKINSLINNKLRFLFISWIGMLKIIWLEVGIKEFWWLNKFWFKVKTQNCWIIVCL